MAKRKKQTSKAAKTQTGQVAAPTGKLPVINTKGVGAFAMELLAQVVGSNEDGKDVGLSYAEVFLRVQEQYPEASTSLKSLAWYNSDMKNKKGMKVPIRPRAAAVTPEPVKAKRTGKKAVKAPEPAPETPEEAPAEAAEAPREKELVTA